MTILVLSPWQTFFLISAIFFKLIFSFLCGLSIRLVLISYTVYPLDRLYLWTTEVQTFKEGKDDNNKRLLITVLV